jgi:hypothetical protein
LRVTPLRNSRQLSALPVLALLAACGPSDTDPGKGGVTVAEERALDEAAEMLEQRRLPPEALETAAASGEETPAPAETQAQ